MRSLISVIIFFLKDFFDVDLGKFAEIIVGFFFFLFLIILLLFGLNFFISVLDIYFYCFYFFNKTARCIFDILPDMFNFAIVANPTIDFDITVNTDFENGLNICNDCIEITCQDNFFLVSRLFFTQTNFFILSTLALIKILKNRKVFFFKNWKK